VDNTRDLHSLVNRRFIAKQGKSALDVLHSILMTTTQRILRGQVCSTLSGNFVYYE